MITIYSSVTLISGPLKYEAPPSFPFARSRDNATGLYIRTKLKSQYSVSVSKCNLCLKLYEILNLWKIESDSKKYKYNSSDFKNVEGYFYILSDNMQFFQIKYTNNQTILFHIFSTRVLMYINHDTFNHIKHNKWMCMILVFTCQVGSVCWYPLGFIDDGHLN